MDDVSIHAPREGSDGIVVDLTGPTFKFQSTLPAKGATVPLALSGQFKRFQSTLPAKGATQDGV